MLIDGGVDLDESVSGVGIVSLHFCVCVTVSVCVFMSVFLWLCVTMIVCGVCV